MSKDFGWARLWAIAHAPMLRRGAWYRIVGEGASGLVVLEVPGGDVAVPRTLLEIRPDQPERFTVVYRPSDDRNPVRGQSSDLGKRYAVCPASGSRMRIFGHPEVLECRDCGFRGPVAWWETG